MRHFAIYYWLLSRKDRGNLLIIIYCFFLIYYIFLLHYYMFYYTVKLMWWGCVFAYNLAVVLFNKAKEWKAKKELQDAA